MALEQTWEMVFASTLRMAKKSKKGGFIHSSFKSKNSFVQTKQQEHPTPSATADTRTHSEPSTSKQDDKSVAHTPHQAEAGVSLIEEDKKKEQKVVYSTKESKKNQQQPVQRYDAHKNQEPFRREPLWMSEHLKNYALAVVKELSTQSGSAEAKIPSMSLHCERTLESHKFIRKLSSEKEYQDAASRHTLMTGVSSNAYEVDLKLMNTFLQFGFVHDRLNYLCARFCMLPDTKSRVFGGLLMCIIQTQYDSDDNKNEKEPPQMICWSSKYSVIGKRVHEEIQNLKEDAWMMDVTITKWMVANNIAFDFLKDKKLYPENTSHHLCIIMNACLRAISSSFHRQNPLLSGSRPVTKVLDRWCKQYGLQFHFFYRVVTLFQTLLPQMLDAEECNSFRIDPLITDFHDGEAWCRLVEPLVVDAFPSLYYREYFRKKFHYQSLFGDDECITDKGVLQSSLLRIRPLHIFRSPKVKKDVVWLFFPIFHSEQNS